MDSDSEQIDERSWVIEQKGVAPETRAHAGGL
jgi:hypothetical protein